MQTIALKGRIPSKKNSKQVFRVKGKMIFAPSKNYSIWHKDCVLQIQRQKVYPVENVKFVVLEFYAPDLRGADLSNKTESVMDLLVDCKILKDDNWFVVPRLQLFFMGVDRKNPRVEIKIDGDIQLAKE